jgi:hypothetical protein
MIFFPDSLISIVYSLTCHWWGGGSVMFHLFSYWVVVPDNFSFILIRWADVFAMTINSKFLLQFICPLSNSFFLYSYFIFLFYLLFDNRWYTKCSMQPKYKQTYNIHKYAMKEVASHQYTSTTIFCSI